MKQDKPKFYINDLPNNERCNIHIFLSQGLEITLDFDFENDKFYVIKNINTSDNWVYSEGKPITNYKGKNGDRYIAIETPNKFRDNYRLRMERI